MNVSSKLPSPLKIERGGAGTDVMVRLAPKTLDFTFPVAPPNKASMHSPYGKSYLPILIFPNQSPQKLPIPITGRNGEGLGWGSGGGGGGGGTTK